MDLALLEQVSEVAWRIAPHGPMRVPGLLYATPDLIGGMDDKVYEQVCNVASLPGIQVASFAMPDAHWGYGFPIGGVAAFDPDEGGVISAGGVGFDISCGVRTLLTGLTVEEIEPVKEKLADVLFRTIPAGLGSRAKSSLHLAMDQMEAMLAGGASWAVDQGYGEPADLERIEEHGCMPGARPEYVSEKARKRQQDEMGTLGSGNHYLEVQQVVEIYNPEAANAYGLKENDVVVSIHCGSRGLGHQIGTEFLRRMVMAAEEYGIHLPDRELACAPIRSPLGQEYLGAMQAAMNCAMANRQIITHLTRQAFSQVRPRARLDILYDVSHNTCKEEEHQVNGTKKRLFVHRKGATRSFGPSRSGMAALFGGAGQPVLIGGSMGTASYILAGTDQSEAVAFSSACHGAGRSMSRHEATRTWQGRQVVRDLAGQGIIIRSVSYRGVAEEAPGAYKDVTRVIDAADEAGLAHKVAKLVPKVCIKG